MMKLHNELQARQFPNCRKIASELEVSSKTIQRDIDFMRDQLGLPIDYDQLQFGFYYTETVTSFPSIDVSDVEVAALLVAQKALTHDIARGQLRTFALTRMRKVKTSGIRFKRATGITRSGFGLTDLRLSW